MPPSKTKLLDHFELIPRTVWSLGFVSLFMDVSSEMIHSLLPIFLVSVLHSNITIVGILEGFAEATALIVKTFSGYISDWLGKRKKIILIGYSLAVVTKPLFAFANTVGLVFLARFIDRIGKGIRGAPRDALIADATPSNLRGAAYGLRQALDTLGAVIGPLLAMVLMYLSANNFRTVFWLALIPGLVSVAIIIFYVKDVDSSKTQPIKKKAIGLNELSKLDKSFWLVVIIGGIFTLARLSEAFLLLRGNGLGMSPTMIPLILVTMNIAYSLSAFPVGKLSDRIGRHYLLALGLIILIIADITLVMASSSWMVYLGAVFWGLHMGFTQGILSALIADTAHESLRGSAFGIYNLITGIVMLFGNILAGFLWDKIGPSASFGAGGLFALLTLTLYLPLRKKLKIR